MPLKRCCEIVFVDGGSTDRTRELIQPDFQVIYTSKGRGKQLNAGADATGGEVLFFLHADSELPAHPLEEIACVLRTHLVGCFGIAFRSRSLFMLACRIGSNFRGKYRQIVFGDQGMFMRRSLFYASGKFCEIPLMEDYEFSLRLRKKGIRWGLTRHRMYTSTRRFPASTSGKLRHILKMVQLRRLYRKGVAPGVLADLYDDAR